MRAGLPALTHVSIRTIALYHIISQNASIYYNFLLYKERLNFSCVM